MGEIEWRADLWLQAAEPKYRATYGSDNAGTQWLQNVMPPQGPISSQDLRFLHSINQHGAHNPNNQNPVRWLQSNFQDLWKTGQGYGPVGLF